ncbi:MAG: bifunctional demethylmenaquinone methyltransferase/2-methoxy-6-polyprenyl-1,4-benzoquinol methylase UbiE [Bacteroidetes bacterium]|nr:bifunctional demethylmenaquinone methyltransferase/2-methoxy-6-polyprenyl-1,4-benzoquinol methylase UbiE [Bacteroidota bacterium]
MEKIKSFIINIKAYDLVTIFFFILLIIANIIFNNFVELWATLVLLNIVLISFILIMAYIEYKYENKIVKIFHYWYLAPLVLLTFKEIYLLVHAIRPNDYDWLFIKIDRWIFGTDPTVFLHQFAFPLLTEILQIVYGSFYLLPIFLCLILLYNNKQTAFEFSVFVIIYGFFLSYMGYFLLPGIGPRFTLHDFATINQQLPGLYLTNFLRDIANFGESLLPNTPNPAELVQRDVFPSGHTMITLIVIYLSVRLKSKSKFFFIPWGSLLIFSTVYLWYHYVIDLFGGLIFMLFALWSGKYLFNWWRRKIGKEEFEYNHIHQINHSVLKYDKKKQVKFIFDNIADKYDFLNHLLSFGLDFYWRKKALKLSGLNSKSVLLDVACGTGDVAIEAKKMGVTKIYGADFSFNMLKIFNSKSKWIKGNNIQLVAENMPIKSESFTNITVAFGVRNFYNIEEGFNSFINILKQNGKATIIEFRLPKNFILRFLYEFYFNNILPFIGGIISGNREAYKYLPNSVQDFDKKVNIESLLKKTGFSKVEKYNLTFGTVQVLIATK